MIAKRAFAMWVFAAAMSGVTAGCSSVAVAQDAAQGAACQVRAVSEAFETQEVREGGLVGAFYKPVGVAKGPALLVLGGSEGGKDGVRALGKAFAGQGYAVLALSYHGVEGLPASYVEVPLEYFDKAVDWLAKNPAVDAERIGIYGVSKGGEASLLVGSRNARIHAVAAGVPSSVVFQGGADGSVKSSWTAAGVGVPFLKYDVSVPFDYRDYMGSIHRLYAGALPTVGEHPEAVIPVEKIAGPVMLISGRSDAMWPSTAMSDDVVKRLQDKGFKYGYEHLSYADAGHAVATPPIVGSSKKGPDEAVGGTAAGNAAGRADMWPKLVCFFDKSLKYGR